MNGTISKKTFIEKYLKAVKNDDAAIFAGAGTSISSGFLDWKNLVKEFAEEINLDVDRESDLIKVMQYYYNSKSRKRQSINQVLVDNFSNTILNKTVNALAKLPISTYWTTNYDKLIERALEENRRKPDVKSDSNQLSFKISDSDATVYKMHGDISTPGEAVFIKDDYDSYDEKRALFTTTLKADLVSKTFLFIGYSFEDPNLDRILSKLNMLIEENTREHYCIMKKVARNDYKNEETQIIDESTFKYDQIKQKLKMDDLSRYGIQTLLVDDYYEIPLILEKIYNLQLSDSIFISGSIEFYNEKWTIDKVNNFCFNLSEKLVSNSNIIISGFGLGIGSNIINGALSEIFDNRFGHTNEYLKLYPFPQSHSDSQKLKVLWSRYREMMISKSGICIFMFGNKTENGKCTNANGMFEEFEIACKLGKKVIPLPTTGYQAEKIFEYLEEHNFPEYLSKFKDNLLNVEDENLIDLVIRIVEYIQNKGADL
ncbi:SIR2 family protein [Staphylococcus debuckii]|uniref:NAD(+) hydrolase ThsA n=1 Tax=Staphylococcus debuckii TaxID=2044912 RepID=A0ABU9EUY3_9STAP